MAEQTNTGIREAIVRELTDTHGNAAYLADNLAAVRQERDQFEGDAERHRTEARQAAEDSGRRMRLIVQMYDTLCEVPRTPKVEAALNAIDAEARRSPWIAEQTAVQGGGRG